MQLSTDEARALAFIAALIGLALLGRWVDRPRPVLAEAETVDIAELRARSAAIQAGEAPGNGRSGGSGAARTGVGKAAPAPAAGPPPRVNLNRATAAELEALPGIGPALAARILAWRDSAGRFARVEQLDSVKGVGPALLARLLPLVEVSP